MAGIGTILQLQKVLPTLVGDTLATLNRFPRIGQANPIGVPVLEFNTTTQDNYLRLLDKNGDDIFSPVNLVGGSLFTSDVILQANSPSSKIWRCLLTDTIDPGGEPNNHLVEVTQTPSGATVTGAKTEVTGPLTFADGGISFLGLTNTSFAHQIVQKNDECAVIWFSRVNPKMYFRAIDSSFTFGPETVVESVGIPSKTFKAIYDGSNYVVAYRRKPVSTPELGLIRLDASGAIVDSFLPIVSGGILSPSDFDQEHIKMFYDGTDYHIVFQNLSDFKVYYSKVSKAPFTVTVPPTLVSDPVANVSAGLAGALLYNAAMEGNKLICSNVYFHDPGSGIIADFRGSRFQTDGTVLDLDQQLYFAPIPDIPQRVSLTTIPSGIVIHGDTEFSSHFYFMSVDGVSDVGPLIRPWANPYDGELAIPAGKLGFIDDNFGSFMAILPNSLTTQYEITTFAKSALVAILDNGVNNLVADNLIRNDGLIVSS